MRKNISRKPKKTAAVPLFFVLSALLIFTPLTITAQGGSAMIELPDPETKGSMMLEEAIYKRHSVRSYSDKPLSLGELGQLLWAGKGINVDGVSGPTRTAPSAGGIYPQELFVASGNVEGLDPGIYSYRSEDHTLEMISEGDRRRDLARAALNQNFIADAPAVIVVAAVPERSASKYGRRGSERYVYMDSAHSAQNILLQATALNLAAVPVGAFDDDPVNRVIEPGGAVPLYIIPAGHP
ncbi:MAG: SagB/ThcOx family dehydrogenase [Spirochaetia bacterium]